MSRLPGVQESSSSVDVALEARATDTASRYQLLDLDNSRNKCSSWSKNKYIIIGIVLIAVLLSGSISFLIVYNQNQNLEVELDRYQEIAQSEEAPNTHSNNGVVVVKDLTDDHSKDGPGSKTTTKPSRKTTTKPPIKTSTETSSHSINNGTENENSDTSNEISTTITSVAVIEKDPVAYFNELKDGHAMFLFEECLENRKRHGYKCTAIIETKTMSQTNFTGYGVSKIKAKRTAAESAAIALFNIRFAGTNEDLIAMEKAKSLCDSGTLVPVSSPKG